MGREKNSVVRSKMLKYQLKQFGLNYIHKVGVSPKSG